MRDTSFSICKAIAIILVVLCHSGAPTWMNAIIMQFNVPIFFICAGYFFHVRYVDDGQTFIAHRVTRLYWPFVKWSLFFLVVHNLFFPLGILSEQYGNEIGGVLHPYSWHDFCQRCWSVVFNMSGYDEFICGAYWFFRSLFVSSLAFLFGMKMFRKLRPDDSLIQTAALLGIVMLLLIVWKIGGDLRIVGLASGGYRELLGVLFMSIGFLFHQYRAQIPLRWPLAVAALIMVIVGSRCFPASMSYTANYAQFFGLLPCAIAGFIGVYYLSCKLDSYGGVVKRCLVYVGDRTLYVFAFYLLAFKVVSAIKVAAYGLPWQQVGGHPVVNAYTSDAFWLLYVLVGTTLPLAWLEGYKYLARRYDLSLKSCIKFVLNMSVKAVVLLANLVRKLALLVWDNILGICSAIRDIVKASNPKDE